VKGNTQLDFLFERGREWIMGVLNVTPDSFYAGARLESPAEACAQAERMIQEKVDILDIGGESTRPGAQDVSVREELSRVRPVLEALQQRWPQMPLSIDTQKAEVAEEALSRGADLVNDVSALTQDPRMASVVAQAGCPVILMHRQGNPRTMQEAPHYSDVVADIKLFFEERMAYAVSQGISESQILLDPGIGFGKTLEHNMEILRRLSEFLVLGRPLLIGLSRKTFLGRLISEGSTVAPPSDRLHASVTANLWALTQGASGLRVHDVGATRQALSVWKSLAQSL
jgi:dihydropteroate synthase